MRHIFLLGLMLITVFGCKDGKSASRRIIPESSGNINSLSVVVDNDLWQGEVGEAIRSILAAPVDGLPQDEPLFTINQMPPSVFSDFATKNRTILKLEKSDSASVKIINDVFARPQKVVVVSGSTNQQFIELLTKNATKIVEAFKNEEIKEKQRRISLSLHDLGDIKKDLGVNLKFPTAYRIAKNENGFFWIRKDITTGTQNIMLFELPRHAITRNDSVVNQIIKLRDSIGKVHIPGPTDGSYMITEKAYAPYVFDGIIDNKPTIETKGLWDVKNAFMSGPFVNYIIDDEANNRLLVIEGFTFAPSVEKRDYMFELEAIMKSIQLN
ncbi:DUF4837 family protein [Mangrovimonas aestuarii]|uniref:DUF4837 family protein n=1 Tax=Mangrovimonas aestuarii TaxID=3018443 RepID=UPI002378E62B|nr:DUF4837 family protein [Mangrovimonas aestuarii]